MPFEMPNPGNAFNAMMSYLGPFMEIARQTQARRYAQEPHFTRNALERKAAELEAMELANRAAEAEMKREQQMYQESLSRRRQEEGAEASRASAVRSANPSLMLPSGNQYYGLGREIESLNRRKPVSGAYTAPGY